MNRPAGHWLAAAAVAALGTWICYDSMPGMNWLLWTAAAAICLVAFTRAELDGRRPVAIMAALAVIVAGGAAISAAEFIHVLVLLSVILFMALAMLLSRARALSRVTVAFAVTAPVVAFGNAFLAAVSRAIEATHLVKSARARATLRGLAITLPVIIVFALLLAVADPTFASWRNAIEDLVTSWEFLPRVVFFLALLGLSLGAYSYAAAESPDAGPHVIPAPHRWLGSGERTILLAGVSGLLWLFLIVQVSYLFGNLPSTAGSGVTFAEYARRGFGEMTIVASASVLLIIASERYGIRDARESFNRLLTFALVVAVLLLLGSAFYRVLLYEAAYGFTIARLYAQAFMIVVATALAALSSEILGELDSGRLFRRVAAVAIGVFIVLVYWNHEAWIASRNIHRFAETGKLDQVYLTRDLSPNALPAIIGLLPSLPEPTRSSLAGEITKRYTLRRRLSDDRWYEWNLGRSRAREALLKAGFSIGPQ